FWHVALRWTSLEHTRKEFLIRRSQVRILPGVLIASFSTAPLRFIAMSHRFLLGGAVLLLVAGLTSAAGPSDSVVKITATLRYPNPLKPWAKGDPKEVTGTGIVIDGKRILTNAHLVMYGSDISVQARPGTDRYEAKVAGLGIDVDLAVLALKDEEFFKK